jgi:hypothetical protein
MYTVFATFLLYGTTFFTSIIVTTFRAVCEVLTCSVARWPPSRPLFSNVAVFESRIAVKICGRQSDRERVLKGKLAVIWQFKKLAL